MSSHITHPPVCECAAIMCTAKNIVDTQCRCGAGNTKINRVFHLCSSTAEKKLDYNMAPTTTIETITITRPLKVRKMTGRRPYTYTFLQVIAFICGVIVVFLMFLALTSTDWLMAESWRQGLFVHCIEEDYTPPLPFNLQDPPGCYPSRDAAYIKITAALCIITLVTDSIATLLTGLGLRSQDHNRKYKYYRLAVLVMMIACKYLSSQ